MVTVAGQIEIAAPPEKVREVFLDFAKYPDWATAHIKSIEVSSRQEEGKLQAGDKLKVALSGMTFSPEVNTNTEHEFSWTGALPLHLFSGRHTFRFEPSELTPGHTTFRDEETFGGLLSSVVGFLPGMGGERMEEKFGAFDRELRGRVEGLVAEEGRGG